jgi:hypothetical protein
MPVLLMPQLRRQARDAAYTAVGLQVLALRAVATRVRTFGPTAGALLEQAGPLGEALTDAAPAGVRRWLGQDAPG